MDTVANMTPNIPTINVSQLSDIYSEIYANLAPVISDMEFYSSTFRPLIDSLNLPIPTIATINDMISDRDLFEPLINTSILNGMNVFALTASKMLENYNPATFRIYNSQSLAMHSELIKAAALPIAQLNDYLTSMELPTFDTMIDKFPVSHITKEYDDTIYPQSFQIESVTKPQCDDAQTAENDSYEKYQTNNVNEKSQKQPSFLTNIEWHKEQAISTIIYGIVVPAILQFACNKIALPALEAVIDFSIELINKYLQS